MQWTRADLIEASGAGRSTVSDWINDGQRTIEARFAFNLEREAGFRAEWIMYGTGPERTSDVIHEFPEIHAALLRLERELVRIFRDAAKQK